MQSIKQPLSVTQLEILKVFSYNLSNEELVEFKQHIANYFAKKAIEGANKVWEDKKWSNEDVERMLNTKMRKSKK